MNEIRVGIIGAGYRGVNTLGERIVESAKETGLRISALCDTREDRLTECRTLLQNGFHAAGIDLNISLYDNATELITDPGVDLVMVTTPQSAHRDPAVAALESGKKTYLDKPIAHTLEDAERILDAERRSGGKLMMGFTRRYERPWQRAYELLRDGAVGDLHMLLIRDVIPFHTYFQRWHRRREWSGDGLNDKQAHHMDVFNWFAGTKADRISGFGGRRVYIPRENGPVRCLECEADCPYRSAPRRGDQRLGRPKSQEEHSLTGDSWKNAENEFQRVDTCVYHPGADILDHAVIQVGYDNGVVGSLFVSFFGPKAEDQETLELVGTSGRMRLTRHSGEIDLVNDFGKNHETIHCKGEGFDSSHFGADAVLVSTLRRFYEGEVPVVSADDGYEATRMVMAALESIEDGGKLIQLGGGCISRGSSL
jgi:predicted dehydrogenase